MGSREARAWEIVAAREWGVFHDERGWGLHGVQWCNPKSKRIEMFRTRMSDPVDLVLAADQWLREKRGL